MSAANDAEHQVIERLREHVRSPRHTLSADAPFSTLDVICCRNYLCTFSQRMHEYVIELFHYSLNPRGYLFLGRDDAELENDGAFGAGSGAMTSLLSESSRWR